jgi:ribosome biogenesis GTPase
MNPVLHRLGWTRATAAAWQTHAAEGLRPARVAAQHRGGYIVLTGDDGDPPQLAEHRADLSGKLRRAAAADPAAGPAVGDWAAIRGGVPAGCATIHAVLPRTSQLSRKAAGRTLGEQVVAANVDTVFVVLPLDRPIAERRLERLLIIASGSGADAAIVLTKADLCPDPAAAAAALAPLCERAGRTIPVHTISSLTGDGLAALDHYIDTPRTSALVGASGVGKSTLINRWLGHDRQAVAELTSEGKGRHTTTGRELLVLPHGGLVIDTPGMRELGLWNTDEGLLDIFADVAGVADRCRFRDCGHAEEPGCAIQAAVADGTLAPERAASFLKLLREQAHVDRAKDDLARTRARQADKVAHRALGRLYRDRDRER